jgi:hypothetical protein
VAKAAKVVSPAPAKNSASSIQTRKEVSPYGFFFGKISLGSLCRMLRERQELSKQTFTIQWGRNDENPNLIKDHLSDWPDLCYRIWSDELQARA